jgi:hypothetical protein
VNRSSGVPLQAKTPGRLQGALRNLGKSPQVNRVRGNNPGNIYGFKTPGGRIPGGTQELGGVPPRQLCPGESPRNHILFQNLVGAYLRGYLETWGSPPKSTVSGGISPVLYTVPKTPGVRGVEFRILHEPCTGPIILGDHEHGVLHRGSQLPVGFKPEKIYTRWFSIEKLCVSRFTCAHTPQTPVTLTY